VTTSRRGLWRWLAAGGCLAWCAAALTGSTSTAAATREPLRVLQMNLCDSGIAGCYTGRSVNEAAVVIGSDRPRVVTLNEVCRQDVTTLARALSDVSSGAVASLFEAARDRRTGGPYRCVNGQQYGIGLLVRLASPNHGYIRYSGVYPSQDPRDPEERAWLCLNAVTQFYACTTHLDSKSTTVALAQCRYLLDTAIPTARGQGGYQPTVLGGDLNLRQASAPDVRSCIPAGYIHAGDGGEQQIVATDDFTVDARLPMGMKGTTDHPSLLVTLVPGRPGSMRCRSGPVH
jgi:endonuclease/exonuclease/phosphatase family metal-dependent hydrolase